MDPKNNKFFNFIKNLSYSVAANVISLISSVLVVLLLPRFIGIESYSYYQLYLFYITYVGMAYFGWCEGIYLRIGGKKFEDLDKSIYATQFYIFTALMITVFSIVFAISFIFGNDQNKEFVIGAVCIVGVFMCLRWFVTTLLHGTYRVKEYSLVIVSEKVIFVIFLLFYLILGGKNFQIVIAANVLSVFISLCIGLWYCREKLSAKPVLGIYLLDEIRDNISAGLKVMISTVSSNLIIGFVRMGIENHWGIETFGRVSLTLSISNMFITTINAIGLVIYPILRRTSTVRLSDIYNAMRNLLMIVVFFALIFYYPIDKILSLWLPQYAENLEYVAIFLPICIYESKMSLLINTYYNTLRHEDALMKCNLVSVFLSFILTVLCVYILDNLILSMLIILVVIIFRCITSELLLSRYIQISVKKDIIIELVMTFIFVICNWFFGIIGMFTYAGFYALYLIVKYKDVRDSVNLVKSMM